MNQTVASLYLQLHIGCRVALQVLPNPKEQTETLCELFLNFLQSCLCTLAGNAKDLPNKEFPSPILPLAPSQPFQGNDPCRKQFCKSFFTMWRNRRFHTAPGIPIQCNGIPQALLYECRHGNVGKVSF